MKNMKINPMRKFLRVQQHTTNLRSVFPKVLAHEYIKKHIHVQ